MEHVEQCAASACGGGSGLAETVYVQLHGPGDEEKVYGGSRSIRGGLLKAIDDVTNPNLAPCCGQAGPAQVEKQTEGRQGLGSRGGQGLGLSAPPRRGGGDLSKTRCGCVCGERRRRRVAKTRRGGG